VMGKIVELRERYGLQKIIIVGDRGMITSGNIDQLKDIEGLSIISALTHPQIYALIERKLFQPELFDEKQIAEVTDPEDPTMRETMATNEVVGSYRKLELVESAFRNLN
jgi:hypothetical protein